MIGRLGALLKWLLLLPVFIVVIVLAVANDHVVRVGLNPFDRADMVLELPLYQVGFALFAVGVACGGFVVWNSQRRFRRRARDKGYDAARWRNRAEQAEKSAAGGQTLIAAPRENTGN